MPGLRALGKHSIASVLNVLMLIITIIGWIVFVGSAVILAVSLIVDMSGGEIRGSGIEIYKSVPLSTYLVASATLFVVGLGFILAAGQLRRILRTLIDGDPFVPENASRLTRLALVVACMEIFRYIIGFAVKTFDVKTTVDFSVNLAAWVAVITLMVLSQVFAEGTRLREEEKMTI